MEGQIVGSFDLTQGLLYLSWLFFFGLVLYIQRESNREGYPLESDPPGLSHDNGVIFRPDPKPFPQMHGKTHFAPTPDPKAEPNVNTARVGPYPGSPYDPVGDPLKAGIGPGAYALREDVPDVTFENEPKIVPMSTLDGFAVAAGDLDPHGKPVYGYDDKIAGKITDLWVDRSEQIIRYYEMACGANGDGAKVLIPSNFITVNKGRGFLLCNALLAKQFEDTPKLKSTTQVTRLEEEKVCAYFGAGMLFATPERAEPLV